MIILDAIAELFSLVGVKAAGSMVLNFELIL